MSTQSAPGNRLVSLTMLLFICLACLSPGAAHAATCTVTTDADSGTGSLRALVADSSCDTVQFDADRSVVLTSPIGVTRSVTVDVYRRTGPRPGGVIASNKVTISGGKTNRLFNVIAGASLTIRDLTLANGSADNGGAIYNEGSLRIARSTLLGNSATLGGAIYNKGAMMLNFCTLSGNSAATGGTVYNDGGTATLRHSTAAENSASVTGGVIHSAGGTTNVQFSILWGNSAPETAVAGEPSTTQVSKDGVATVSVTQTIIKGGYTGEVAIDAAESNRVRTNLDLDPQLAPLDYPLTRWNYAGVTATKAYFPLSGSSARNAIYSCEKTVVDADDLTCQNCEYEFNSGTGVVCSLGSVQNVGTSLGLNNPSNVTQSTPLNTQFLPISFGTWVSNSEGTVPNSPAGSQIYIFGADNGPSKAGAIITPNPVVVAADKTVSFTATANDISGGYKLQACTVYPYDWIGHTDGGEQVCTEIDLTNSCQQNAVVTNGDDDGVGSLRWALTNTCPGSTITFDKDYTIVVKSLLSWSGGRTIDGTGRKITVSGDGKTVVFYGESGGGTIRDLIIADGYFTDSWTKTHPYDDAMFAGGMQISTNDSSALFSLVNVVFRNNWSDANGGALSIVNEGSSKVTLTNVLFHGNEAAGYGGAIAAISFSNNSPVTYNGNSSTSGTVPVDGNSPYVSGTTVTVLGNSGTLVKTGFTFNCWNTAANGSGTSRVAASSFSMGSANITLYAQWSADVTGPSLTVSTLANGSVTNNATLNVTGTVSDSESGVKNVTVNGNPATVTGGNFTIAITLVDGANTVTTIATDNANNSTTDSRTITLDRAAPGLTITLPADNSTTSNTFTSVTGSVDDATATVTAKVNGGTNTSATMSSTNFSITLNLVSGLNTIDITATDPAGNSSSAKRTVTSDASAPGLSVTSPAQDTGTTETSITVSGLVTESVTSATVSIAVDGQTFNPTVATDGSFSQSITLATDKTYAVVVTATDQAGNTATVQRNIIKTTAGSGDISGDGVVDIADALTHL